MNQDTEKAPGGQTPRAEDPERDQHMTNDISTLIPIRDHEGQQVASGRDLHAYLEVGRDYTTWFRQMVAYGFTEGEDYLPVSGEVAREGRGTVIRIDHAVTFDMAKELGMLQRTEKGKRIRQYFIAIEKNGALTEDQIVHQALQITNRKVKALEAKVAEDAPKVDYHDTFVADDDKMLFRTAASDLDMTEKALRELLVAKGWIYKEETTRWSEKRQEKVKITRWSEYSHKKPYFYRRLDHDAPRFRGEVMWTLKITPSGAAAITRLVKNVEVAA